MPEQPGHSPEDNQEVPTSLSADALSEALAAEVPEAAEGDTTEQAISYEEASAKLHTDAESEHADEPASEKPDNAWAADPAEIARLNAEAERTGIVGEDGFSLRIGEAKTAEDLLGIVGEVSASDLPEEVKTELLEHASEVRAGLQPAEAQAVESEAPASTPEPPATAEIASAEKPEIPATKAESTADPADKLAALTDRMREMSSREDAEMLRDVLKRSDYSEDPRYGAFLAEAREAAARYGIDLSSEGPSKSISIETVAPKTSEIPAAKPTKAELRRQRQEKNQQNIANEQARRKYLGEDAGSDFSGMIVDRGGAEVREHPDQVDDPEAHRESVRQSASQRILEATHPDRVEKTQESPDELLERVRAVVEAPADTPETPTSDREELLDRVREVAESPAGENQAKPDDQPKSDVSEQTPSASTETPEQTAARRGRLAETLSPNLIRDIDAAKEVADKENSDRARAESDKAHELAGGLVQSRAEAEEMAFAAKETSEKMALSELAARNLHELGMDEVAEFSLKHQQEALNHLMDEASKAYRAGLGEQVKAVLEGSDGMRVQLSGDQLKYREDLLSTFVGKDRVPFSTKLDEKLGVQEMFYRAAGTDLVFVERWDTKTGRVVDMVGVDQPGTVEKRFAQDTAIGRMRKAIGLATDVEKPGQALERTLSANAPAGLTDVRGAGPLANYSGNNIREFIMQESHMSGVAREQFKQKQRRTQRPGLLSWFGGSR